MSLPKRQFFVDKLTHLFFCTCEFHCFADGNKRLAITLSLQFLLFNGYLGIEHRVKLEQEIISLKLMERVFGNRSKFYENH